MSVCLFVRELLRRLWVHGHQTWQGGRGQARKTPRENKILKFQLVAMETRKFSPGSDIGPMMLNLLLWDLLSQTT